MFEVLDKVRVVAIALWEGEVDTGVRVAQQGDLAVVLEVVEHDDFVAYVIQLADGTVTDAYGHEIVRVK